jgi:hypothetical protein
MTSKQVMLSAALLMAAALWAGGCHQIREFIDTMNDGVFTGPTADPLVAPYATRHVWAIAPLRNESGTRQADGLLLADKLHAQLANAANLEALPVNRTLEAMQALQLTEITTQAQAMQLLNKMGADGLIVGTITAYNPYDPPKLGLVLELYVNAKVDQSEVLDLRRLTVAPNDTAHPAPPYGGVPGAPGGTPPGGAGGYRGPVSTVSAVLDAGDPDVCDQLQRYANKRDGAPDAEGWHRYRASMDLYSQFASYVMCWRLLDAEKSRLAEAGGKQVARP